MKIHGMGTDITSVARIRSINERHGDRFVSRIFHDEEISDANKRSDSAPFYAARWAAREAFLKALGTDVSHIPYKDIEVVKDQAGPVTIKLHGRARESFAACGASCIHLSISHEREYAIATVILESNSV